MRKIQTSDNSFLMSLQNDYAFRALLGEERNKPILADLLRAIISDPVENITLMNTHMTRGFEPEKEPILDIRASIAPNVQVDIEMQGWPFNAMPRRSIYYWSRIFANLQAGKGYDTLNRTLLRITHHKANATGPSGYPKGNYLVSLIRGDSNYPIKNRILKSEKLQRNGY